MNNLKLFSFTLLLLAVGLIIHFQKGQLFVLFSEGYANSETQIKGDDFPKTLIDSTGIQFQLEKPPSRIISATLATDHILSDLVDPQRIVAVSSYIDYPSMSNIVGFYPPSISRTQGEIESMLALQPDLVFVASYSNPETVRYLLRSDISIVRLGEFTSFANIFKNIRLVANVTDSQAKGEAIIRSTQQRIEFIKNQVKDQAKEQAKPRILYYDLNGYSVGGNTLTDEAIKLAGGINVADGIIADGENKISEELAISLQPDVIVLNQWVLNHKQDEVSPAQQLKDKQAWQDVPAVKNNRVYSIPGNLLRSVSQHRIQGVEMMAKLIHPQIKIYQEKIDVQ